MGQEQSQELTLDTIKPMPADISWMYQHDAKFIDGKIEYKEFKGVRGKYGFGTEIAPLEEREPKNEKSVIEVVFAWDGDCLEKLKLLKWSDEMKVIKSYVSKTKVLSEEGKLIKQEAETLLSYHEELMNRLTELTSYKIDKLNVKLVSSIENHLDTSQLPYDEKSRTMVHVLMPWTSPNGSWFGKDPNKRTFMF